MTDPVDNLNRQWADRGVRAYSGFTRNPWRWIVGVIVGVVLVGGVVVFAGWQIGWWFQTQNVNRESHLFRNGYANQQTLRDQITANVGNVLSVASQITATNDPAEKAALRAQAKALVAIVCQDASEVTGDPLPAAQRQFVRTNCEAGNVSPAEARGRLIEDFAESVSWIAPPDEDPLAVATEERS